LQAQFKTVQDDKQPIGMNENSRPFTNHSFSLNDGDRIYLLMDLLTNLVVKLGKRN